MESRAVQTAVPTPSPNSAARELARQNKLERNARVEAWRSIVAASATECTCTVSSAPSTVADSADSSGHDASNHTRPEADNTTRSHAITPATTTSHEPQYEVNGAPVVCSDCARLGAPLFMGQAEFDEPIEVVQPRRALSISKALKSLTRRLTLNPNKVTREKTKPSHETIPHTGDDEDPLPQKPDIPSRDSFVESRKHKMKKSHRDILLRQDKDQLANAKARQKSHLSIDLNRVNEALMITSPPLSRPTTRAERPPVPFLPASPPQSPPPKASEHQHAGDVDDDAKLSSTSSGAGAADVLVRQRLKEAARGIERLERAQRLLNRDNAKSTTTTNATDTLAAQGGTPQLPVRAPA